MVRLDWLVAVGAGLAFGLLPGCAVTTRRDQVVPEVPPLPVPQVAEPLPPPPQSVGSPYHATAVHAPPPPTVVVQASPPSTPRVPLLPPADELTVRPVNLSESPAPSREAVQVVSRQTPAPLPEVHAKPLDDPPLVAALRCYLNRRPGEAIKWLDRYEKPNQELLLVLLPLAARMTEGSVDKADPQEVAALLNQLDGLTAPLRRRAPLEITRACFCKWIDRFGSYEPFPTNYAFRPGEEVNVYVEILNFSTELRGQVYTTRLATSLEIRDYYDNRKWPEPGGKDDGPVTKMSASRSELHDFYNLCSFQIPRLAHGDYKLCINVTDLPTGRTARYELDFRITAMPSLSN
jgi:hypothetical protein